MEEPVVDNRRSRSPPLASGSEHNIDDDKSPSPGAASSSKLPEWQDPSTATPASAATSDKRKDSDDDEDDDHNVVEAKQSLSSSSTEAQQALPLRTELTNGNGSNGSNPETSTTDKAANTTSTTDAQESPTSDSATDAPQRQSNGQNRNSFDDNESELSEPDSNVHSPSAVDLDEIVVGAKPNSGRKSSPLRVASDNEDETMADADGPVVSQYPKRKRTSVFADLSESKLEVPGVDGGRGFKPKSRQSLGGVKGVLLGQWRDSPVPEKENRHAVIGFIDIRDRLRTRIQPVTTTGEPISSEYPLPPGPGGSWVTFERVIFSKHLVGLDHFQIKEYVRLREDVPDGSEEEKRATVKEAIRRVKENPLFDNPVTQPAVAHGAELPGALASPRRPEVKRRRVSGGFAAINPNGSTDPPEPSPTSVSHPLLQPRPTSGLSMHGPLPGTRPTRILLGYWMGSSEPDARDRHAVYGILGQNDMFRVKVVRETRDGRFVDGNFPSGAGALWIQYEEVEFEPHLKPLSRGEIKEYCRVRQYQLDHGEAPDERAANEAKAVSEAQSRAGSGYKHIHQHAIAPNYQALASDIDALEHPNGKADAGPELRQLRRNETRVDGRTPRTSLNETEIRASGRPQHDSEPRSSESRSSSRAQAEGLERANALARREIARVEAAQGRADRHAFHRERAAAMAADAVAAAAAAAAAAASPASATNGRTRFHESEDMQRLNRVWARQETLRMKAGAEDAKIYDGIKYERKATGPFIGKLVSQGTIINIDGEDYVEYRVLTKPSFF